MRIGYLVPEFPSQTHIFFWREIQALRALGEEVFILSTRRPSPEACRHDFATQAVAETRYLFPPRGRSIARWASNRFQGMGSGFAYLTHLESPFKERLQQVAFLASAVDLVQWAAEHRIEHIHGHSCANSAHLLALSKLMGGPSFSLTLHGDLDVYGSDHGAKMAGADFVCAVGKHLCQQIIQRIGLPEHRVLPTFMGVETDKLALLGQRRMGEAGKLRLVTVARLHPNKGHFHTLAAISRARREGMDVTYTIAGRGDFRNALHAKIEELGLQNSVKLVGTVSEMEAFELLSNADAFALTSVGSGEAWPVSVMEAMGAGLPVIASIIGATTEMITSGVDGFLVPQRDERAIFESIANLGHNLQTRTRIGSAARITARNRFDVRTSAGFLRNAILDRRSANDHDR